MPKSRTAAEVVPLLITVAEEPGARVVVLPTVTVAASPCGPGRPVASVIVAGEGVEAPIEADSSIWTMRAIGS